MPLPPPAPRKPLHTRTVRFEGFARDDGLFDIDAELVDSKSYPIQMHDRGLLAPGGAIHRMRVRVTVDEGLVIRQIVAAIDDAPFGECGRAQEPVRKLVGTTLGAGWRKAIEAAMGGVAGCTHLRELLFNVATAAFQTIPVYLSQQRAARGETTDPDAPAPHFVGKCMSWDREGPVVKRVLPMYYRAPDTPPDKA